MMKSCDQSMDEHLLQPPQLNNLPEVIIEEAEDLEHENNVAVDNTSNDDKHIEELENYLEELKLQLDVVIQEKDMEVPLRQK